jgi:chromosome segregation ATPase
MTEPLTPEREAYIRRGAWGSSDRRVLLREIDRLRAELKSVVETLNRVADERRAFCDERNEARDECDRLRAEVEVWKRAALALESDVERLAADAKRLAEAGWGAKNLIRRLVMRHGYPKTARDGLRFTLNLLLNALRQHEDRVK